MTSGGSGSRREAMTGAGPLGLQGHSLGFLRLRFRLRLRFWRQLLFLSIHLEAGQASGTSCHPKRLSERLCLPVPLWVPICHFPQGNLFPPLSLEEGLLESHFRGEIEAQGGGTSCQSTVQSQVDSRWRSCSPGLLFTLTTAARGHSGPEGGGYLIPHNHLLISEGLSQCP